MNKFNFDRIRFAIPEKNKKIMEALAMEAKNYFVGSWKRQAFDGVSWAKRKTETKKSKGKAILVNKGTLRKAVNNSLKSVTDKKVIFEVNMPKGEKYPQYLNEGTDNMVARPFMKNSKELNEILRKKFQKISEKIWQM